MNDEEAREKYWEAKYLLDEIIKAGAESKKDILEELENDLEE
jgi:hypothetical protein